MTFGMVIEIAGLVVEVTTGVVGYFGGRKLRTYRQVLRRRIFLLLYSTEHDSPQALVDAILDDHAKASQKDKGYRRLRKRHLYIAYEMYRGHSDYDVFAKIDEQLQARAYEPLRGYHDPLSRDGAKERWSSGENDEIIVASAKGEGS